MAGPSVTPTQWHNALVNTGVSTVRVEFLDQSFMPEPDVVFENDWVMGGEVQMSLDGDVTRMATVRLLDPGRRISYDPFNVTNYGVGMERFIRVIYSVKVDDGQWVDTPMITGPATKVSRTGNEVEIEVQGKDALANDPNGVPRTFTYKPDKDMYELVREVMSSMGERRFMFPEGNGPKIGKKITIERWSFPWPRLRSIVSRKGFILYYDGLGRLVLRRKSGGVVWSFRHGVDVLTEPSLTWDLLELRNTVVTTYTDKQDKEHRVYTNFKPPHFLSPVRIARNDEPRYLVTFWDSDTAKTEASARAAANNALTQYDDVPLAIQFDALTVPHLKEYDLLEYVAANGHTYQWTNRELTWSLDPSGSMTVGANKDALRQRRRKHGKKKHSRKHGGHD